MPFQAIYIMRAMLATCVSIYTKGSGIENKKDKSYRELDLTVS